MMSWIQIALAEYFRRLVARGLGGARAKTDLFAVFDLGSSGVSNIAKGKSAMIAEAFISGHRKARE